MSEEKKRIRPTWAMVRSLQDKIEVLTKEKLDITIELEDMSNKFADLLERYRLRCEELEKCQKRGFFSKLFRR